MGDGAAEARARNDPSSYATDAATTCGQKTLDFSIINEAAFLNPYLANGFVSIGADAVVVDVGANIGDFAIQAARMCPAGRVLAVEPVRSAGEMIEAHARLNGVANVEWIWAALSGSEGEGDAAPAGSPYAHGAAALQRVKMKTLPSLMAEHASTISTS